MKSLSNKIINPYFILIFVSIIFRSLATICGKKAAILSNEIGINNLYKNVWFGLELLFLFIQAISWITVLKKIKLSFAYPFMSLVYLFNLLAAGLLFNEEILIKNIFGILVIISGIVVISLEKNDKIYD